MKLIAIFHEPQECGNPYILLVNSFDGQVVKRIDLPRGYATAGYKEDYTYYKGRYINNAKFIASEDTFKQGMEEQGINMRGWCVYKRRKTDIADFVKAILPKEVINLITIG